MIPLKKANILIPQNIDMSKWSVVACDQYTKEPEYWEEVRSLTNGEKTTLDLTLPEIYLESNDVQERINQINNNMENILKANILKEYSNTMIYLERMQSDGKVRKGIVASIDLEDYSYLKGSNSLVRATEKTVIERIPPRLKVRENALIELPHVMLLIDDDKKDIIDSLDQKVTNEDLVYDFDLMLKGGHIKGYQLNESIIEDVLNKIEKLGDKELFNKRYGLNNKDVLLFSVGDGNHSLATAKTHYENLKKNLSKEEYLNHPARYALVEVVNLHSEALEFEPIHRVVFDTDINKLIKEFIEYYNINENDKEGQKITYITANETKILYIKNTNSNLCVGSLQTFLDKYLSKNKGEIDYIHGDDVTINLSQKEGNIGFILPKMEKSELFKTVILDGALPRKTFSMGHSYDKRYYLESRKIK